MTEDLLKEAIQLILLDERKLRETETSLGKKVKWGDKRHVKDLQDQIARLEHRRSREKRGSAARDSYTRVLNRLKGELKSANRAVHESSET